MFRVRIISQVTMENETAAANYSPGCMSIGTAVPNATAKALPLPNGIAHQSGATAKRIRKPRRKNSSMSGTTAASPTNRTIKNVHAHAAES